MQARGWGGASYLEADSSCPAAPAGCKKGILEDEMGLATVQKLFVDMKQTLYQNQKPSRKDT
jgi:hypothetical protein